MLARHRHSSLAAWAAGFILAVFFSPVIASSARSGPAPASPPAAARGGEREPLTFKSVVGHWLLKYPGNYGYRFNLYPNYRATVALYLNNETIFFNGVYTISDTDRLRINIYEMKVEHRSAPGRSRGYVKAKSSHFLFGGYKIVKNRSQTLHLRPLSIVIDGTNSEGYFEPLIKLGRVQ